MKFRWEFMEALFLHLREKLLEKPQTGKNSTIQEH